MLDLYFCWHERTVHAQTSAMPHQPNDTTTGACSPWLKHMLGPQLASAGKHFATSKARHQHSG